MRLVLVLARLVPAVIRFGGPRGKLVWSGRLRPGRELRFGLRRALWVESSQFEEVTVLLPLARSPLATRQTFYTAITRAARRVRLIGSAESVLACVDRPAARATGLRDRLDGTLN